MMVQVEALVPFVTGLPDGSFESVVKGDKLSVPKAKAQALVDAEYAKFVEVDEPPAAPVEKPPANKSAGASPEAKARKRQPRPAPSVE